MANPVYLILSGVRRTIAARELGLATIRAVITTGPGAGTEFEVSLDDLYSPKDWVSRSDQNGRYMAVERIMADPALRANVARVEVAVLKPKRMKYFTRLTDVVLEA